MGATAKGQLALNAQVVRIGASLNLTGVFQTVHQVYKDRWLKVTMIHLCNTDAAAATVRLCIVPNGGTAVQTNAFLWDFSIPAHDMIEVGDGLLLAPSTLIQALSGSVGVVNLFVSGEET